jgi:energy-coupling factor transporter ATP-binding protein EcfA2
MGNVGTKPTSTGPDSVRICFRWPATHFELIGTAMKYLSFTIIKYRAIAQPLEVNLEKTSLVPIIGINESGKTTILHAIFAFDAYNDVFNSKLKHLDDTNNLYKLGEDNGASVQARIRISGDDLKKALKEIQDDPKQPDSVKKACAKYLRKCSDIGSELTLTRNLHTKTYDIGFTEFTDKALNNILGRHIVSRLPFILYFDDFRDSFPEEIEIKPPENGNQTEGWLAIVDRLFQETDPNFSVFKLDDQDERQRKSIIAKVKKKLNTTLAREWQNFKLDNNDALEINLDYIPSKTVSGVVELPRLKFEIVEKDSDDVEHYFYVRDRSKGFFWFFNFVMKLEFNPKVITNDGVDAIYLLDEPGSYLHAAAQSKLCKKLKELSVRNGVLYCTHSHYLLNPEVVPLSTIRIASKGESFDINLTTIYEYPDDGPEKRNAFQPIYDALQIRPFQLDIGKDERVVLTEGIYDFYCLDMIIPGYRFVPGQNAESINYYIALMIGWAVKFNALWDNDPEGNAARAACRRKFGEAILAKTQVLPLFGRSKKTILQDLFQGSDLRNIKTALGIPANSSFTKTISSLYYSDNRHTVLKENLSAATRQNFLLVEERFTF